MLLRSGDARDFLGYSGSFGGLKCCTQQCSGYLVVVDMKLRAKYMLGMLTNHCILLALEHSFLT